ncbi:hypothetical protein ACTXT7_005046 [Hymenolepis weldensis]
MLPYNAQFLLTGNYLASGGKDSTKTGRFQYNRNFPRNLETPPRHGQKYRKTRPLKPLYTDVKDDESSARRCTSSDVDGRMHWLIPINMSNG